MLFCVISRRINIHCMSIPSGREERGSYEFQLILSSIHFGFINSSIGQYGLNYCIS